VELNQFYHTRGGPQVTANNPHEAVAAALSKVSLFQDLDENERLLLAHSVRRSNFKPGEVVVQHLDEDDDVYIILSGTLIASIISPEGREVAFDPLEEGQCPMAWCNFGR
jgi:non-ribosomal peptide synthetase component F